MSNPQSREIKDAIMKYIDQGMTDKQHIYSNIVRDLGVPRPTVRRVAGTLRTELAAEISTLEDRLRLSKERLNGIR